MLVALVVPLCAQDAPAQKAGRGPRNLKVLTPEDLRSGVMGKYAAALGVHCDFCHAQDKASDEKPQKNIARMMITMVKDINSKVSTAAGGAAKEYVTCYTCHRGKTEPETAPAAPGQP